MTDYATATECKAFTRITYEDYRTLTTEEFDAFVSLLAGFASRAMESYCERLDWDYHDDTTTGLEYSVGPQNQRMIKIHGPVIAITSVETRTGSGDTYTTMDSEDYTYKNFPQAGVAKAPLSNLKRTGFGMYPLGLRTRNWATRIGTPSWTRWRTVFWRGYEDVRVKYTWGYVNIPDEINRICIMLVDDWLKKSIKDEVGKRIKATSPEDIQMMMRYEIPEHLKEALKAWKSTGGIAAL